MKESKIWFYINQIQKKFKDYHFIRIESATINGIPDVNACVKGHEFWLELKSNNTKNYGLSKYQINWFIKRRRAGGFAFILHYTPLKSEFKLLEVREDGFPFVVSRFPHTKPSLVCIQEILTAAARAAHPEHL